VVNESTDLYVFDEIRYAAYVIGVVMRDQDVVDLRDARIFHCCLDAIDVAAIVAGPAGIDEQRSTRRSHKQGGLAAFNVNRIDEKVFRRIFLRLGARLRSKQQQSAEG
jgi:hypothetical protein